MKTFYKFFFIFSCTFTFYFPVLNSSAQALINNKGNRNQSYPIVTETKPEIVHLINQVSQDSIESHIRYMQQFFRIATSPEALIVQNWLVSKFESYGYEDITIHYFTLNSQQLDAGNVVVVKKGTEFPDEYILITSHYDSPSYNNPVSPGADDNASGTAGVLECARLLKDFPTKRSIMFVPFNAEEFWLKGSLPFAQKCASENLNIIALFNMDMIGWLPIDKPDTIMASGYSYISRTLFEFYQQTANTYIPSIPTICFSEGDMYGGDHMPFNIQEYPALFISDMEYRKLNYCYHKPCDTIGLGVDTSGVNNLILARAFVQATLSAAAELANAWLPPQHLSACQGIDKITVSWDSDKESTSYKLFKNNAILKETTNNFYVDNNVEIGERYEYYVIAVNNGEETALSNRDEITLVLPLQLPYSNNFSENKFGFEQSDWVLRNFQNKPSLCNTSAGGLFPDNYLSIAELDWFPILHNIENIAIRFKWRGTIKGMMGEVFNYVGSNAGLWFEVTTDRKTWHKLAYFSGTYNSWKDYEFSLNAYKNSEFFQVRFRLESSGSMAWSYNKIGYITDIEINYTLGIDNAKAHPPYISTFNFTPNPASSFINIATNQQEPYHISIYDMAGRVVFAQDSFRDGTLSIAHLKSGNYLLVASTKQHRMARKFVKQ